MVAVVGVAGGLLSHSPGDSPPSSPTAIELEGPIESINDLILDQIIRARSDLPVAGQVTIQAETSPISNPSTVQRDKLVVGVNPPLENYDQIRNNAGAVLNRISRPAGAAGIMPPSPSPRLDQNLIDMVAAWVAEGTPNN